MIELVGVYKFFDKTSYNLRKIYIKIYNIMCVTICVNNITLFDSIKSIFILAKIVF